jgi:hypothetical protein
MGQDRACGEAQADTGQVNAPFAFASAVPRYETWWLAKVRDVTSSDDDDLHDRVSIP